VLGAGTSSNPELDIVNGTRAAIPAQRPLAVESHPGDIGVYASGLDFGGTRSLTVDHHIATS
jgi:hypothetical protein